MILGGDKLRIRCSALVAKLRRQLADRIALPGRNRVSLSPADVAPLADDPFIGMWRDREDLADSDAWVRTMRRREWTDRGS